MQPAQGGRQILRRQRRPEQSMQDHGDTNDEQWGLENWPGMSPAEQPAQAGDEHQVERLRIMRLQGRNE